MEEGKRTEKVQIAFVLDKDDSVLEMKFIKPGDIGGVRGGYSTRRVVIVDGEMWPPVSPPKK